MQATGAARGPGSWPVRRFTGPQGPSRGSPSFEGLQTLLAPAQSVKTRRRPLCRNRHDQRACARLGSLPQAAISQPQPDYLITASGYCQPLGRSVLHSDLCACLQAASLGGSRFRCPFAQPADNAIRICGCQEFAPGQFFPDVFPASWLASLYNPAAHCTADCGEKQHHEAGYRHHDDTFG